jgi:class 3 adenylate cyclase
MTPETGLALFRRAGAYLLDEGLPDGVVESLPEGFAELLDDVQPTPPPPVWCGSLEFVPRDRPSYHVDYAVLRIRDATGEILGTVSLSNMSVRAGLLAELGRGDAAMYERMARLVQPRRHAATILFADLESSGALSRALPTAAYFGLIRDLTSAFDALVAEHAGIVGKHAGDGWTAFVLAHDVGGPSAAVAACLRVAGGMRAAVDALSDNLTLPDGERVRINIGVHWAAGVYLGQLVPGSRLDVTALGDEVNECARIQECARNGTTLVSKPAMELLDVDDAKRLSVDPDSALYQALADMPAATDKTRRDAATLAVTSVTVS